MNRKMERSTSSNSDAQGTKVAPVRETKRRQRRWRRVNSVSLAALLLIVSLVEDALPARLASGEPVQQRGQGQLQQQQSVELVSLQDSALPFAINANRALPLGSYTNTKRARKMSAFIPMRGRKDTRDLMGNDSLRELLRSRLMAPRGSGQQQQQQQLQESAAEPAVLMRESEPSDASLVHLTGQRVIIPPQFLHQLQAHSLAARAPATIISREQVVEGDNLQQQEPVALAGGGGGEQMMQAKWRRAFHPMRGKKAAATEQLDELYANAMISSAGSDDNQGLDGPEEF